MFFYVAIPCDCVIVCGITSVAFQQLYQVAMVSILLPLGVYFDQVSQLLVAKHIPLVHCHQLFCTCVRLCVCVCF